MWALRHKVGPLRRCKGGRVHIPEPHRLAKSERHSGRHGQRANVHTVVPVDQKHPQLCDFLCPNVQVRELLSACCWRNSSTRPQPRIQQHNGAKYTFMKHGANFQ